jgi:prolyl-tRNA synthetase
LASAEQVVAVTGAPVGFAGPVGLSLPVYADWEVAAIADGVVGANEADAHWTGFCASRDCPKVVWSDFRIADAGDPCGRCGGTLDAYRGIEVGQVFYLGTKYSAPMQANFLNADGEDLPLAMGCYGIGVSRTVAAAVEQHHDEDGIRWPMALAPYHVIVLPMSSKEEAVVAEAERLYEALRERGVDVLLDDRDLRPGVKFKDADLVGIPLRVTVGGRGIESGALEVRSRATGVTEHVPLATIVDDLVERVRAALASGSEA